MADNISVQTDPHTLSPDKGSISFAAYVDGHKIECIITAEALRAHFKSPDKPIDEVFSENQQVIRSMAEFLLTTDHQQVDGQLVIEGEDSGRRAWRR